MKKFYFLAISFLLVLCSDSSIAQSLVHYWDFNVSTSQTTLFTPTESIVGTPTIAYEAGGSSVIEIPGTGQNFNIQNLNARSGSASGDHLRFNNPGSGGSLLFSLPTTGYSDVIVKYATRRSSTSAAAETQVITYSTDGTTFVPFTTIVPVAGDPALATLDFSAISSADNNANFKIRISFLQGTGGVTGNHRFDNFTVEGTSSGPDVSIPTITFLPVDNAVDVLAYDDIKLTFSEDVRLVDDAPITNVNVANVVEVRETNSGGTLVPFGATISGREITINPTDNLGSGQLYYVTLKPNVVEDLAGNAITSAQAITFTTIVQQTIFQPGDLLFVAYRMNATSTDDEVALVTLVNILPGTFINFTDAKFTDNVPAQCSGGITWKAPVAGVAAGTVITIKTEALTSNIGTVTGSGFGLSSGGDQVMVYTGTAASPSYITALSSNAWVSAATSCSGSNSRIPSTLIDGQNAINLSTAPGNVSGNAVNAYFNGSQAGTISTIKTAILTPSNWVAIAGSTAPQTWPAFAFPGPPSVSSVAVGNQTTIVVTFNAAVTSASATTLANYTGITGVQSAQLSADGKVVTLSFATPFAINGSYSLSVSGISNSDGLTMVAPHSFSFTYSTTISFDKKFITVNEQAGNATVVLKIQNPSVSTVKLVAKAAPWSTAQSSDYTFTSQSIDLTGSTELTMNVVVPIVNDTDAEQSEYLVLELTDASGVTISGGSYITVFIADNDRVAPQPTTGSISLSHVGSYSPPVAGTAEIVVHDAASQRLFIISSIESRLDIASFSNPGAITHIESIDMTPYGGITSVATKNGIVAVASPNADQTLNGSVVFFNTNGEFQKQVTVGALPDMITFSPDGTKVLTANEGQPNDAYTVDPEGSISIIDISGAIAGLSQSNVTTLLFDAFNAQETALRSAGVRKLKLSSTLSQDFEPEFITVSSDSKKAWVTLQENNAIAEINLETKAITSVWAMGKKDMNAFGNGFDASDNNNTIQIANWPVKAFYIPDAIANYSVGANQYLVTANEGDEKEYAGLTERTTVGAVNLDATVFPNAAVLKESHNLGRLRITNLSGDTDGDGDYDELNMNGSRSFTIWNAVTKEKVFDSGDQFEQITAVDPTFSGLFNADNENNTLKGRSRAKGPEPEGLTIATINNRTFAFVALERVGGVMVYDITDPASVKFIEYKNTRSTTAYMGDHGPEGIIFVSREASPDGKRYILVANEISGSVSVYEVTGKDLCITPAKPTITISGALTANVTLTSSAATGNQWFNNGDVIAGATNQTYSITAPGVYTVRVKVDDCESEMSAQMSVIITGLEEDASNVIGLFPNPAEEMVNIALPGTGAKEVAIYDSKGSLQHTVNTSETEVSIAVKQFTNGLYIVKVRTSFGIHIGKFIKR